MALLGVNIDHVATIREARKTAYPNVLDAAKIAIRGGADQITVHLREDRRHIQDRDVFQLKDAVTVPLNLEMAAYPEIVEIAIRLKPHTATLVPEKRQELTTEGGLDVVANFKALRETVHKLNSAGIVVSMFIDPSREQIDASIEVGGKSVELHTGSFCDAKDEGVRSHEMERLVSASAYAVSRNIKLAAGHGISYENIKEIVTKIPKIEEYNIGHSIVARAVFVGLEEAVREMKGAINDSRHRS